MSLRAAFIWIAALTCTAMVTAGCASTNQVMAQYREKMLRADYEGAAKLTRTRSTNWSDGDSLLWRLYAGNAEWLAGNLDRSVEQFDLAEDLIGKFDAQSFLTRGNAYAATGLERTFCCLYKAIAYLIDGKLSAARTEFNRAADRQENWIYERRNEIASAQKELAKKLADSSQASAVAQNQKTIWADSTFRETIRKECGVELSARNAPAAVSSTDYQNAYLDHLCGIFRWLAGDGGRGYLRDASQLRPDSSALAQDFAQCDAGLKPHDQVWLYIEDGIAPDLEEWRMDLPLALIPGLSDYVLYAGMALPRLREQPQAAESYIVHSANGTLTPEPLEDLDRLVRTEFNVRFPEILTAEITRVLLLTATQVALGAAAENSDHSGIWRAAQIGAAILEAGSAHADLRIWNTLPKSVLLLRFPRPEDGKATIIARSQEIEERLPIEIPQGNSIVWIRNLSSRTPMRCRTATFR